MFTQGMKGGRLVLVSLKCVTPLFPASRFLLFRSALVSPSDPAPGFTTRADSIVKTPKDSAAEARNAGHMDQAVALMNDAIVLWESIGFRTCQEMRSWSDPGSMTLRLRPDPQDLPVYF
jgi:hypothetical protein